jgi:thymidylate kinase
MRQTQRRLLRRPRTVAFIGPDGSGKSTIARRVAATLPVPTRYLYMGVNLESSSEMLPTTRLVLFAKRRRGGRPDMTARVATPPAGGNGALATVRSVVRIGAWIAEEWYRALLAARARRRGQLVIFDRHFFCDYYATDVRPVLPGGDERRRPLASRIHGAMLRRWYPRPDATFLLDAPAAVLLARKGEGTLESIEQLRADYRSLADVLPAFTVVDVDRPIDSVAADLGTRVMALVGGSPAGIETVAPGTVR